MAKQPDFDALNDKAQYLTTKIRQYRKGRDPNAPSPQTKLTDVANDLYDLFADLDRAIPKMVDDIGNLYEKSGNNEQAMQAYQDQLQQVHRTFKSYQTLLNMVADVQIGLTEALHDGSASTDVTRRGRWNYDSVVEEMRQKI